MEPIRTLLSSLLSITALLLSLSMVAAKAQTTVPQTPQNSTGATFTTGTELVLVPVVVRKGKEHVSDLTQADFSVFEDGRRQKIAFLKTTKTGVVLKHEGGQNVFSNELDTGGETPRVTVVVVDSANIPFADQAQVRDSFLKFLTYDAAHRGPTAVVSFQRSGVRVVQDFTTDPAVLAALVERHPSKKNDSTQVQSGGGAPSPDAKQQPATPHPEILGILPRSLPELRSGGDALSTSTLLGNQFGRFEPQYGDDAADLAAKNLQLRDIIEMELRGLNMLAESLAGIPGRKTLIWLTGNFPFDLDNPNSYLSPSAVNQYQDMTPHGGTGRDGIAAGPRPPALQLPSASALGTSDLVVLRPLYEQAMKSLANANVAVYPVDTRGVISFFPEADVPSADAVNVFNTQTERSFQNFSLHQGMRTFAHNTGGEPCFGSNDAGPCLQEAVADSDSYYLLGYYRERKDNKPGWRKLKVKVDRDGVDVLTRDGYFYSAEKPDSKEARQRDVVSALGSPVNFSGLPFTVRLQPAAADDKKPMHDLPFELQIPPTSLTPLSSGNAGMSLEVVCTASTPKGVFADQIAQTVGGPMKPEVIAQITKQGVLYRNVLHVPRGSLMLHFVVRDNLDGRTGSVVVPLLVE
jgi:VWFA-related protein